jgi:hypothetical protein
MKTRDEWVRALESHIALCRQSEPLPKRESFLEEQEQQCRILGGHLIAWLNDSGPQLMRERNALARIGGWDKDPHIVYVTDTPGVVAAAEILGESPLALTYCRAAELATFSEREADDRLQFHCELHSFFERAKEQDAVGLRAQYEIAGTSTLWVHHTLSKMGPNFERGARHLWAFDGQQPSLVAEAFEAWIS